MRERDWMLDLILLWEECELEQHERCEHWHPSIELGQD